MTSKECLEAILDMLNYEQVDECDKKSLLRIINRDLEKLEKLEIANKNNEGLVRENVDLINRNLKLQDENTKLKQAIKLLKPLVVVKKINGGYVVNARGFEILTECAYELLKEVLENE